MILCIRNRRVFSPLTNSSLITTLLYGPGMKPVHENFRGSLPQIRPDSQQSAPVRLSERGGLLRFDRANHFQAANRDFGSSSDAGLAPDCYSKR
jgi:hypothetical protein